MNEFAERFQRIVNEYYGGKVNALNKLVGNSPTIIPRIIKSANNPSIDVIMKVLELHPDLSAEWLLRGEGEMKKMPAVKQEALLTELDDYKTEVNRLKDENLDLLREHREQNTEIKELHKMLINAKGAMKNYLEGDF